MSTNSKPHGLRRAGFISAIALGSFLLFLVQPMIARLALPRLGGSPAVWNSAMLVYQSLLLAGYAYAHFSGRLGRRGQLALHTAVFAIAAAWLPIGLSGTLPNESTDPVLWAPLLIAGSIGPLFLVVASQAPLLQRWYSLSGCGDPYPLYAASNLGSLAGLLSYPLLLEPLAGVEEQRLVWSAGYVLLALLTISMGASILKGPADSAALTGEHHPAPGWHRYARWIILAAIPSGLMLSTTTHITTDIAVTPLLWVLPLGVYLLSFVAAFSGRDQLITAATRGAPILILVEAGVAFGAAGGTPTLSIPLGLMTLYAVSVCLHGTLNRERPAPEHLTSFYLAMSFGGALGGVFCALVAPAAFDWTWEHPILLLCAMIVIPHAPFARTGFRNSRVAVSLAVGAVLLACVSLTEHPVLIVYAGAAAALIGVVSTVFVGHARSSVASLLAVMACGAAASGISDSGVEARFRSYFGSYRIMSSGNARAIVSGTTIHGIQIVSPEPSTEPLTYYGRTSGVARGMDVARRLRAGRLRVGVVGLGAGTLACYAHAGDAWRFYEIDPEVIRVATDPRYFTYLSRCAKSAKIVEGDARISLSKEPDASLDVIVLDAFSSDAVPTHIITRQAFDDYARRLGPGGIVLVHISNRHLDLEPVMAANRDWHPVVLMDNQDKAARQFLNSSMWVAMTRDEAASRAIIASDSRWRQANTRRGFSGWTDQRSSILPIIRY